VAMTKRDEKAALITALAVSSSLISPIAMTSGSLLSADRIISLYPNPTSSPPPLALHHLRTVPQDLQG